MRLEGTKKTGVEEIVKEEVARRGDISDLEGNWAFLNPQFLQTENIISKL